MAYFHGAGRGAIGIGGFEFGECWAHFVAQHLCFLGTAFLRVTGSFKGFEETVQDLVGYLEREEKPSTFLQPFNHLAGCFAAIVHQRQGIPLSVPDMLGGRDACANDRFPLSKNA